MAVTVEDVLARLRGVEKCGDGWKAFCPGHDDEHDKSLSITRGDKRPVVFNCFVGCDLDAIARGLSMEPGDFNPDANGRSAAAIMPGRGKVARRASSTPAAASSSGAVDLDAYAAKVGLPAKFLADELGHPDAGLSNLTHKVGTHGRLPGVAFPYLDTADELLFRKFRPVLDAVKGGPPKYVTIKRGRGKTPAVPYGLWRLRGYRETHKSLVLVEGESDAHTLWFHGFPGLGIPGANNVGCLLPEHLEGFEFLFVVQEPAKGGAKVDAGAKFVGAVVELLAECGWGGQAFRIPMSRRAKDPNALYLSDPGRFPERFRRLCDVNTAMPLSGPDPLDLLECLDDVEEEKVEFLVEPYFVRGELNFLIGAGGDGKGHVSLSLAAAVTTGQGFPGYEGQAPARVLLFAPEDKTSKVVAPRFRTAGGDKKLCHVFKFDAGAAFKFSAADLVMLRRMLDQLDPDLVVFDPVVEFYGGALDMNRANDMREKLRPVAKLAEEYNTCFVLVAHVTKSNQIGRAVQALFGSVDQGNIARSVVGIYPDPERPRTPERTPGLMLHAKHNLSRPGEGERFEISGESPGTLVWAGAAGMTADDLVARNAAGGPDRHSVDEAAELLRGLLPVNGDEVAASDIFKICRSAGFNDTMTRRARQKIGADWRRGPKPGSAGGFGKDGHILWFMPRPGEEIGDRRKGGAMSVLGAGDAGEVKNPGPAPF